MKTLRAKYLGVCAACREPIKLGDLINFYGRGQAVHSACDTETDTGHDETYHEVGFPPSRGTLASDRRMSQRGLSITRLSSGAVLTQNSQGRCEDAPCCGCCS